ncbi:hypothetical protein PV08_01543 [Exophiala spinifera]|uniref:Rhodopsin domain-containing protein n=1 Tax=Exophiala spinifera TaxID=91928 RepID=A0A0D2CBT1_9EURO|nr:uncharacterized protein PV08_01543 [Exophiala spinifera]KIW20964.1 hypothetical protein PV08_01543 [Exophiala spinifera]
MAGTQAVVLSMTFSSVAFIFVSLRCFSRILFAKRLFIEDVLIVLALVCSFGVAGAIEVERQYGLGENLYTLPPDQTVPGLKAFWASIFLYGLCLTLVKCSICCQLLRLFTETKYKVALQCILAFLIVFGIIAAVVTVFTCTPPRDFWEEMILPDKCINYVPWWFFSASVSILTDCVLCILPMPILKKLHLPPRQKYGLIAVFAVGGFACIVSILRLHAIYKFSRSSDASEANVEAAYWSAIEVNTGIICACMPMIRPLMNLIWKKIFRSSTRTVSVTSESREYNMKYGPPSALQSWRTPLEDVSFCTVPDNMKDYLEASGNHHRNEESESLAGATPSLALTRSDVECGRPHG